MQGRSAALLPPRTDLEKAERDEVVPAVRATQRDPGPESRHTGVSVSAHEHGDPALDQGLSEVVIAPELGRQRDRPVAPLGCFVEFAASMCIEVIALKAATSSGPGPSVSRIAVPARMVASASTWRPASTSGPDAAHEKPSFVADIAGGAASLDRRSVRRVRLVQAAEHVELVGEEFLEAYLLVDREPIAEPEGVGEM